MSKFLIYLSFSIFLSVAGFAGIRAGVGQRDITPPIGAPSAGSFERVGGMTSVHDPLLASALVIDNGKKLIAFCSVDHLGFLQELTQQVKCQIQDRLNIDRIEIYISSTHTHSGGGGYINDPDLGELIAGPYDATLVKLYVNGVASAIIEAVDNLQEAKIGIGYGKVKGLTQYDGVFPKGIGPPTDLTVIKVTKLDGSPLSALFNYSLYPDILITSSEDQQNIMMAFSADVVAFTREHIKNLLGAAVVPVFFNGAKGELLANVSDPNDLFKSCDVVGKKLSHAIFKVWNSTHTKTDLDISTLKHTYIFEPKPTPNGFVLPVENYNTEINLIVFDRYQAFITIPAELSCSYDPILKRKAKELGFQQLSIFDIVNDAHGYVYSPESWRLSPSEVEFSWGGEMYGKVIEEKIISLLNSLKPKAI